MRRTGFLCIFATALLARSADVQHRAVRNNRLVVKLVLPHCNRFSSDQLHYLLSDAVDKTYCAACHSILLPFHNTVSCAKTLVTEGEVPVFLSRSEFSIGYQRLIHTYIAGRCGGSYTTV